MYASARVKVLVRATLIWTARVKSVSKKAKERLSKNQRKILEILTKYQELTARDIAEILWARDIRYKTAEYSSIHRSLRTLHEKGLVEKVGGVLKWRRAKERQKERALSEL
jgi:Fe2+ or Zn2+ uptake regulation protein